MRDILISSGIKKITSRKTPENAIVPEIHRQYDRRCVSNYQEMIASASSDRRDFIRDSNFAVVREKIDALRDLFTLNRFCLELSLSIARSSWRRDFEDDSTRMHDYLDIMYPP